MTAFGVEDAYPAIESTFNFSKYASQLSDVDAANHNFVRILERVRSDINETERLLCIPTIHSVVENSPLKRTWIKNGIHNIKSALSDIGLFIERIRLDKNSGDPSNFATRVRLVLQNFGRLENQCSELATCHQTLIAILNILSPLEFLTNIKSIDPPPKILQSSSDTATWDPTSPAQFGKKAISNALANPTTYNDIHIFSNEADDKAPPKQRLRAASNIASSNNLQSQHSTSIQADFPKPLFSQPMTTLYAQKRFSHLLNISTQTNGPQEEVIRAGPSISTMPPRLSIMTHEQSDSTPNGISERNPDQWRDTLVSPLVSASTTSSLTPGGPFSATRPSQERAQSQLSWKDYLNSHSLREATNCPPTSSSPAGGGLQAEMHYLNIETHPTDPSYSTRRQSAPPMPFTVELSVEKSRYRPYVPPRTNPAANNRTQNDSYPSRTSPSSARSSLDIPSALQPGTPVERNTYPSFSVPSVRPRSKSSIGPIREAEECPVAMSLHIQYNSRPRATTQSGSQLQEAKLEMPHHTHFVGRPRSTTPPKPSIAGKATMPHHSQYLASPTSEGAVLMPHHQNYPRPRSTGPIARHEERPAMPHHSSYVPRPRAPYPTAPGVSLAHISPELGSRNGGWGAPHIIAQNRRPQSMMAPPRGSYHG